MRFSVLGGLTGFSPTVLIRFSAATVARTLARLGWRNRGDEVRHLHIIIAPVTTRLNPLHPEKNFWSHHEKC